MYQECIEVAIESIKLFEDMLTRPQAFTVKDLAIRGSDVMSLGINQGKAVGHALRLCLEAVIDDRIANEKEALLELVKANI